MPKLSNIAAIFCISIIYVYMAAHMQEISIVQAFGSIFSLFVLYICT